MVIGTEPVWYHGHCVHCVQDFRKIAKHLLGRSTGDCIKYYYRNQKHEEFAAVRRKQQLKKRRMQSSEKGRQYMGGRAGQPKGAPIPQGGHRNHMDAHAHAPVLAHMSRIRVGCHNTRGNSLA